MTTPSIRRHSAERNRTKVYASVKHSMLMFTNISVNKNNPSYNSIDQRN